MFREPISLLLIDDDDIDSETIKREFKKHKIASTFVRACDGVEALEILRGEEGRERLTLPYVILLDIKMPRMNGHEFLEELRNDEELQRSVVFVLTTSDAERDVDQAYKKHVAGYLTKASVGTDNSNVAGLIDQYWRHVELPK